jgi:transcriptional regulator with XRE-family HTH domain
MTHIAAQIKVKLEEKRLSPTALEKHAGLRPGAVTNILYGKSKNPGLTVIQAVANALGCTVSDLLGENLFQPEKTKHLSRNKKNLLEITPNYPWQINLYLECFEAIASFVKAKSVNITKEKLLGYIDEVYLYSIKGDSHIVDEKFAQWLIEKNENITN